MSVRILNSRRFGRCSERGVLAFERRVKNKLPADYREFLLEHNGGTPEVAVVDVKGVNSSVQHLNGLHNGPRWARLEALRKTYAGRMPDGLLPIGSDPFGNVYCLGLAGRWRGKLWFWDHETEADEGEPPRTDNLTLVAANFRSFLAKLRRAAPVPRLPPARNLHDAAMRGDLVAVERLLAKGADVHARDKQGRTAVVLASWADHHDVMRALMNAGAQPDTPHIAALFAKWRKGRTSARRR